MSKKKPPKNSVKKDDRGAELGVPESPYPQFRLLIEAAKRGVRKLMPYLWTVIFIVVMLSLVYFLRLDWWVAGFGALMVIPFLVLLFVIKQVISSPREDVKLLVRFTIWFVTILFAASASFFVSSAFFGWPLNFRPAATVAEDDGARTIRRFYTLIDQGKFDGAWDLIHSERKKEIAKTVPTWKEFAKAYVTTREHHIDKIERIQDTSGPGRTYRMLFAVRDEFPVSHLYKSRPNSVKDWFQANSLDKKRIIDTVINDVKNAFDVQESLEPKIVQFIEQRHFESLFKPDFIFDVGRVMGLVPQKGHLPSPETVWRYFVQKVQLQEEQPGIWKIKTGLSPRLVEATYEPGASAP